MEQLSLIFLIIFMIYMGEKKSQGVYKIIGGLLTFALALTVVTSPVVFVVLIGLALYLLVSVFVN